jgi:uroporphyrinogen decarboxylase
MGDVDLAKVKKEIGNKMCLKGNIDLRYVIKMGTTELIEFKVKEAIRAAAPSGGLP